LNRYIRLRMKLNWVSLFIFFSLSAYSQQRQIDSIEQELTRHVAHDSLRLNLLSELSYLYYSIDPEKGIKSADEAIELARTLVDSNKIAIAYAYKGHNYSALGKDSAALKMYDAASDIRRLTNDKVGMARLIYNKGLVYFNQSDYLRANDANKEAYEVFKVEKDSFLMAKMLNSMGINYMYLSQYPQSLKAYMDAKVIYEDLSLQDNLEYANIHANIGLLYAHLNKPELSEQFQKLALQHFKKLGFKEGEANSLTNLGRLSTEKGNTEVAIDLYHQAYDIMKLIHNERGMASALTNIGIAHVEEGRYQAAIPFFKQTQVIYEKLSNANNLAIVHDNLGECYLNLFEQSVKAADLDASLFHYRKSLENAKTANSVRLQYVANEGIAEALSKKGDYKNAFDYKSSSVVLRDSFLSTDKREEIAKLEAKYEYEGEKALLKADFDKKQAIVKADLDKQQFISLMILLGAFFFLLATGVGFVLYKKRRDALAAKKVADFKAEVAETELKALRSQMNPHFIFNSLNSIRDYMHKNDMKAAEGYLMKFAKLTRSILENSEKNWITLEEDLELMKIYIEIESMRLRSPIASKIEIDGDVDPENTLVPPMILQPFIENSIWHGVSQKEGMGELVIKVRTDGEFLICEVDDNGIGRQKSIEMKTTKKSMGLKITQSRLEILNRLKDKKGSFQVHDKEVGTSVEVKLPLELQF